MNKVGKKADSTQVKVDDQLDQASSGQTDLEKKVKDLHTLVLLLEEWAGLKQKKGGLSDHKQLKNAFLALEQRINDMEINSRKKVKL